MADVERIGVDETKKLVDRGEATLVCAYRDQEKCESMRLGNALTYPEFEKKRDSLDKERNLVFYCA
jgi:hypothetical protein